MVWTYSTCFSVQIEFFYKNSQNSLFFITIIIPIFLILTFINDDNFFLNINIVNLGATPGRQFASLCTMPVTDTACDTNRLSSAQRLEPVVVL